MHCIDRADAVTELIPGLSARPRGPGAASFEVCSSVCAFTTLHFPSQAKGGLFSTQRGDQGGSHRFIKLPVPTTNAAGHFSLMAPPGRAVSIWLWSGDTSQHSSASRPGCS